ncbi:branched-chain amino acid ABC transporter permease [Rhodovibrionaceae bacterium A322]
MTDHIIKPTIERKPLLEQLQDRLPLLLTPILALAALALIGQPSTWLTLTVAGLAMGVMLFIMASGLTLVFGLMDVLNFGHGAFISLGAYIGVTVMLALGGFMASDSLWVNLLAIVPAIMAAVVVSGLAGWGFERVLVRPVYGAHLKQILITMGGLIVTEQLILTLWGPEIIPITRPTSLQGIFLIGDVTIERYRVYATLLGLGIFIAMLWAMKKTKLGLLIRAGVENSEMVEALGYRVGIIFIGVFIAGSALAGLGGVMWALYEEVITAHIGQSLMIMVFIVVIIGGLGSVEGAFIGALLVGLMSNYTSYLFPTISLGSTILLMVLVLMWRPMGLFPVVKVK